MEKCLISKKCGSCQLLNMSYEDTLKYKEKYVLECFQKYDIKPDISEIVESKNNVKYRNKMILSFSSINGKISAGFYEENSHKIVPFSTCLMHSDAQNNVAKTFVMLLNKLHIRVYDEDKNTGLIKYILIKEAHVTREIMLVIVTKEEMFPARANLIKGLKDANLNIKTIVQNINPRKTNIVLGEKERILFGPGFIIDKLNDLKFKITSKSFFQVNPKQAEKLYNKVYEYSLLNNEQKVLDAYSGVGTIGLIMASKVKEVVSVENNKQAFFAAIDNAKENGIKNVRFINDDATNYMVNLDKDSNKFDLVIMDPPRAGSTVEFINALTALSPKKIVYVSCDPLTLARDVKEFERRNYKIKKMCLVDMFCWTKHIESVVLLEPVNKINKPVTRKKYFTGEDRELLQENRMSKSTKYNVCDRHWDGA